MAGAQCCENPPALSSSCGEGRVDIIGGLKAYFAGSPDCKVAIVLVSDVFGYEAPNLRKLADKVAAAGFFVIVPDFFHGDPYVPDPQKPITAWLENHGTSKGFEDAKPVFEELKNKGICAVGAAGMCWGAKVVVELAKAEYINAAVLLHPSLVTVDDIKEVNCPIAILGAETDQISPPELVKQFEVILSTKPQYSMYILSIKWQERDLAYRDLDTLLLEFILVPSFVKIFPGAEHGWTVRYDCNDKVAVKKAEEAHEDMLCWFVKYLK